MSEANNRGVNRVDANGDGTRHAAVPATPAASTTSFSVNAGRAAFRNGPSTEGSRDMEELRRQQFAMRSFTESVEMDIPPAPELPATLDIDQYDFGRASRLTSSSTADTIVEVKRDETLGETQKYPMTVPAPGHTEQEMEMHKSLVRVESDDSDSELGTPVGPKPANHKPAMDRDHEALRREYSAAAKQRPRPTTPTSWCTLESYAAEQEKATAAPAEKMKVVIPKKSLRTKQPEEFYQAMANQLPPQTRPRLSSMDLDPDADIIEQNPEYKDKAPKAPVVHRRTSVDWEPFDDEKEVSEKTKRMEAKPSTPPSSPGEAKPETNVDEVAEKLQEAVEPLEKAVQEDTAAAFARDLFGANSDDWAIGTTAEGAAEESVTALVTPAGEEKTDAGAEQPEPEAAASVEPMESGEPEATAHTQQLEEELQSQVQTEEEQSLADARTDEQQQYYDYSAYGYDANYYAGYDQTQTTGDGTAYDQNYAYDPSAYSYDQSNAQTTAAYDYSQCDHSAYGAYGTDYAYGTDGATASTTAYDTTAYGYDYSQNATGTEQPTDYSAYGYDYSADPNAASTSAYGTADQTATAADTAGDTTSTTTTAAAPTDYSAYGHEASPAAYGYEQSDTTATSSGADTYAYDQSGYYDTSAYGGAYSYGDATTDYSQYGYPAATDYGTTESSAEPTAHEATSAVSSTTQFVQPLPSMPAREHDPFSWEAQQSHYDTHGSAAPPPRPPPVPPAPDRSPSPCTAPETPKGPPARPAPPSVEAAARPPRPPAPSPARPPPPTAKSAPPPPPPPKPTKTEAPEEEEEDAWAKFKAMTEQVTSAVKSTEEKMKELASQSAADEIKDESYLATVGGSQGFMTPAVQRQMQQLEEEKRKAKADKKKAKHLKRSQSPELDPMKEMDMDKAAAALAAQLAITRAHDLGDWKPPGAEESPKTEAPPPPPPPPPPTVSKVVEEVKEPEPEPQHEPEQSAYKEIDENAAEPAQVDFATNWAAFDDVVASASHLPASESDFFSTHLKEVPPAASEDPFAPMKSLDPFAPTNGGDTFDPFDIRPAEDIVAQAKERASQIAARQDELDPDYLQHPVSLMSTPTPEGGSPVSARPVGFDDEFHPDAEDSFTPLYDEDDSQPLVEFPTKFAGDGWDLMIRYPPKKKIMADRYWKPCFVRIRGNTLAIFDSRTETRPMQEIMLQPTYSLSDATLQAYDVYGKIHTVKLQCVQYKERIGIRAGQISRLVEGHITKYGLPIEHAAQVNVLAKFGCLKAEDLTSFTNVIEDFLFTAPLKREVAPLYKQDEVQIHCYDEYQAYVDKMGVVSNQLARVRMFCLAFVSGSPLLEIGLNDRRRQGKEIVRRKDILPMYTERWIRFENLHFHSTVDQKAFEEEQVLRLSPPDGNFFEICRFRVRPPKNREKPLTIKSLMKIAGSKIEIRIDAMAAAQTQRAKGTTESTRLIPCEDIVVRFPIPEAWIYIFREERTWGVGSVHSKKRRAGKVKNLKDRLMGAVEHTETSLIEVAIGEAKYEHVYRSLVWRIPRLPEKHHGAYKEHMLKCRFDLSSFDLMPEAFLPTCEVEFTMPLATISNTVVRSVSVEQHEDSDRVEKFVRYVAKCKYQVEVDYVQCNDLDNDAIFDPTVVNPDAHRDHPADPHQPMFNPEDVQQQHGGYGIEFSESEMGAHRRRNDSSSDEEPEKRAVPIIEIDMKGYGY